MNTIAPLLTAFATVAYVPMVNECRCHRDVRRPHGTKGRHSGTKVGANRAKAKAARAARKARR